MAQTVPSAAAASGRQSHDVAHRGVLSTGGRLRTLEFVKIKLTSALWLGEQ